MHEQEFPQTDQARLIGALFIGWTIIDATLEVALARFLKLDPYVSSMVTSRLEFQKKCKLILSLLDHCGSIRTKDKCKDIIKKIRGKCNIRNAFAHGVLLKSATTLVVYDRPSSDQHKITKHSYHLDKLQREVIELAQLADELQKVFDIDQNNFDSFFAEVARGSEENS